MRDHRIRGSLSGYPLESSTDRTLSYIAMPVTHLES